MSDQDSQRPPQADAASREERDPTASYQPGSEPTAHNEAARAGRDAWLQPGDTVAGRFVIVRFIARGGMGEVYEANDTALKTRVALKTLRSELGADSTSLDRFRREVLLARSVAHPNVCRVFELHSTIVEGTSLTFLTMEYLEGESLAAFLKRKGPLDPAEALPLVRQMASALDAAHAHGVVHRDFKPSNVVLVTPKAVSGSDAARVVVTDFGIARSLASSREAFETTGGTGTEGFIGTPSYVAPEQVSREVEIGPPADLYSFGIVLYEMVTGTLPFEADTPMGAMLQRLKDPPRRPELVRRGLDPRWSGAILRCLETDPRRRPASAANVLDELTGRPSRRRHGRRWVWAGVAAAIVGLVVAGLLVRHGGRRAGAGGSSPRSLAVLSLATQVSPADAWLGPALVQLLGAEFQDAKGIQGRPWWRVAEAYSSLGIDPDQLLDDEKRARLYELLPVDEIVEGSISCATETGGGDCRLRIELRRRDRSIVGQVEKVVPDSEATVAIADVGRWAREMLGAPAESGLAPGFAARRSRPPKVTRLLGEAVAAYMRHDLARSRELLELATSIAPDDFDAHDALSRVLERQGLFVAARRAAERAAEVAGPDAPRLQQTAQARVDFLGDDPARAIAAYQGLLRARPGDSDLVLALSGRLPPFQALELVKQTRALPGAPSRDLLLAIREMLLEKQLGHDARAGQIWEVTRNLAERLKARREVSLLLEQYIGNQPAMWDLGRAETLALETGDRQRAAYLHLLRSGDGTNEPKRRMNAESLASFRSLGDRVGAHHVLVRRALFADDWDASSRVLAEAAAELVPTGEPLSREYQIASAEVELHRGNLPAARRALEMAEAARARPSMELLIDWPRLGTLTNAADLQFEVPAQEDQLDQAEAKARDLLLRSRSTAIREDGPEGFLCRVQCERGQGEEGSRCFQRLLGSRPRVGRWGQAAALCAWESHDLEVAEYAAFAANSPGVTALTAAFRYSGDGRAELERMIAVARKEHDVLEQLRLQLLLGSAEMRSWKMFGRLPAMRADVARGRRRLQSLVADAKRRGFMLLARKAERELARDPFPPK